ncbi:acyl--CoA ligase [Paenibacillus tritici]|uniref:class I adenylate-forming enzyme family protein n=1 Tax=Paenibacillus tritici TaxID=1873425 RepID=UPI001BA9C343|nr:class I adenylate-forming enzyme family protein [Paenibacillus tritici]QUL57064.1 acyl--CoA ligase [Paenibacillus tritici]
MNKRGIKILSKGYGIMKFSHLRDLVECNNTPSNKAAVIEVNGRCVYTYAELKSLVNDLKTELYNLNVKERMHVAVVGGNSLQFIVAYFAIQSIDAVCIPMSGSEAKFDMDRIIDTCQISYVLFCDDYNEEHSLRLSVVRRKFGITLCRVSLEFDTTNCPKDVALLLRTSGSILNPKIVMHSHSSLLFSANSHAESVGYTKEERTLVVLPLCYVFAHTSQMLATLSVGGTIILFPSGNMFNVNSFKDVVQEFRITSTALMATYLRMLATTAERSLFKLESLQHICFAGGPTPQSIVSSLSRNLKNVKLLRAYGLTEAGPRVSVVRPANSEYNVSSGHPVEGIEVQITNVADGVGEIIVKGPNIMRGYYNDVDATNLVIKDEFLHTGDLGFLDNNGELHVVGRIKNMVISMGMKVFPEEVEDILNSHYLVKESLVKGVSNEVFGEMVIAFIVLEEKEAEEEEVEKILVGHCKGRLPTHSVPRKIYVVEKLEKTINGKLKRTSAAHTNILSS